MKIFTAIVTIITSIGLLFSISSTALAETEAAPLKQYDVEIIIFEDAHARYLNSETWPQHDDSVSTDDESIQGQSIINTKKNKPAVEIENIKPSILTQEYKRINRSSQYEVLQYSAWRQPGLESSKAFDVELASLKNSHSAKSENSISGTIKVVLARYLHLFGELEYHRPLQSKAGATDNTQQGQESADASYGPASLASENSYPIEFRRRMRSKELHYIDHPLVGILVQINPVEIVKEETENATAVQ